MIRSASRHPVAASAHPPFALVPLLAALAATPAFAAPGFNVAEAPLFTTSTINPNVLLMLDTSQSMNATMAGKVISGLNPGTRSNVARSVLRDVLDEERFRFNWGLGSFAVLPGNKDPLPIFAYYLGTSTTMVYTNVCDDIVDGVGTSDKWGMRAVVTGGVKTDEFGRLPCIPNPDTGNGFGYITFSRSGDDADVNDVLYSVAPASFFYGVGVPSATNTDYARLRTQSSEPEGWKKADGTGGWINDSTVTCLTGKAPCSVQTVGSTDSGWLPQVSEFPRQIWVRRAGASGFNNAISGKGIVNEPVVKSQTTTTAEATAEQSHFDRLKALLGPEQTTAVGTTPELKNAAQRTPLAGSLRTANDYFGGHYSSGGTTQPSPVTSSCQRNYVVLATDGNPTGRTTVDANGVAHNYTSAERVNTLDPSTGAYIFGQAARDVFAEIDALRSTAFGTGALDVQTFVVGLGDTVANPGSIAALDEMARRGGTGAAFLASSGDALKDSMRSIVTGIGSGEGAGSSVAFSSRSFSAGSLLYQAKFVAAPGWTGELLALPIGPDGLPGSTPVWQASAQLVKQDWNTGRQILTYKPSLSKGIAFRWPTLIKMLTANDFDQSQVDALNKSVSGPPDGFGSQRIAYLRGDTSNEDRNKTSAPEFRNRLNDPTGAKVPNVLGDIVDSTPLYVAGPSAGYPAGMESASYPAFAATWAGRPPVVYVGANDGMLHAFDAQTGVERFAYVPGLVYTSETTPTVSPLVQLTSPSYQHKFTVNGSPSVGDVFFDGAWRSLLVSGLRYGGRGVFALDVTDPANVTEKNANAVVRWEYTELGMGYVYAKPLIVKTNDGKWSVIFGNGVPSKQGGKSRLYILDPANGSVKKMLSTSIGSTTDPNGLSGVTAVDIDGNGTADVVYAGDVQGYLWKFDLSSTSTGDWNISVGIGGSDNSPLFVAGDKRPITGAPDVTRHPNGGFMIVFGTGRYLAKEDVSDIAKQTIYGIWDRSDIEVKEAALQQQQILASTATAPNGDVYRFSTHRVGTPSDNVLAEDLDKAITRSAYFTGARGWYIDLPTSGERVVSDAAIRGGRAVFSSIIPSTDPCLPGGTGWVIEVDAVTGNRRAGATFDTNNDLLTTNADFLKVSAGAAAANNTSGWRIDSLASQAAAMSFRSESNNFERRFVQGSKATLRTKVGPGRPGERQRVQWRVVE